jgi:hypothetical protein
MLKISKEFFNEEDTARRLNNTICTYAGEPCLVRSIAGSKKVNLTFFTKQSAEKYPPRVEHFDPLFSYQAFPLGFIFSKRSKSAIYIYRRPLRTTYAGLTAQAVASKPLRGDEGSYIDWSDMVTEEMRNCILGTVTLLPEALEIMTKQPDIKSYPLSRNFAIGRFGRCIILYYKTTALGAIDVSTSTLSSELTMRDSLIVKELKSLGIIAKVKNNV